MSAICDVVAQLIYLSNSCSVYVIMPSRSVLLGAKDCVRHQKEKDNSINNNWEKLCSNTWSAVEASLFN